MGGYACSARKARVLNDGFIGSVHRLIFEKWHIYWLGPHSPIRPVWFLSLSHIRVSITSACVILKQMCDKNTKHHWTVWTNWTKGVVKPFYTVYGDKYDEK